MSVPAIRLRITLAALALLVAACGGDGGTTTTIGELTTTTGAATTTQPSTPVACDEPAEPATIGSPVSATIAPSTGYPDNARYYCFEVSASGDITVTVTDLTADGDLYVGFGSIGSVQGADQGEWRSDQFGTADESVTIPGAAVGTYYVEVVDFEGQGLDFTLTVTTGGGQASSDCEDPAEPLTPGVPMEGVIEATADPYPANARYFCVEVPAGATSLVLTLDDLEVDLDLYVGYGSIDSVQGLDAGSWDWAGQELGTTPEYIEITNPEAGIYYIEVFDYDQAGSTFTLLAIID